MTGAGSSSSGTARDCVCAVSLQQGCVTGLGTAAEGQQTATTTSQAQFLTLAEGRRYLIVGSFDCVYWQISVMWKC